MQARLALRSKIGRVIRMLEEAGCIDVETPILTGHPENPGLPRA